MGHRANYVIRENGVNELFYSHWGALTIAEDVFWGPEKTEEFIRANKPCDDWLDSVWAEGGIALNKDARTLFYYYFEWPDEDDIRAVYEELLAKQWPVWTVKKAAEWGHLAESVGVSRESVTAQRDPPPPIDMDRLGSNSRFYGLLSLNSANGWSDHAIDFMMTGVLMNGPDILPRVQEIASLDAVRNSSDEAPGDQLSDFAAIDPDRREIRLDVPYYDLDEVPFVEAAWPGWKLVISSGGPQGHFAYTGRRCPDDFIPTPKPPDPPPPVRSRAECERIVWERLRGTDKRKDDTQAFVRRKVGEIGPAILAPGVLDRVPSNRPGYIARIAMFFRRIRSGAS